MALSAPCSDARSRPLLRAKLWPALGFGLLSVVTHFDGDWVTHSEGWPERVEGPRS